MEREVTPALPNLQNPPPAMELTPGVTVGFALSLFLAQVPAGTPVCCWLNGVMVADVDNTFVMEGDRLIFGILPQGGGGGSGKQIGMIIVGIILIAISYGTATGPVFSWWASAGLSMGIGLVLSGVAGMLIKPPALNANSLQTSVSADRSYYAFTGQSNQSKPYQNVPRLYGRHKYFPAIAVQPQVDNYGTISEIVCLYDFGMGAISLEDIQIGETSIANYDTQTRVYVGEQNINLAWMHSRSYYQTLNHTLQHDTVNIKTITTSPDCISCDLDISFPGGLARVADSGGLQDTSVRFLTEFSPAGAQNWQPVWQDAYSGARIAVVYVTPPVQAYVQAAVLSRPIKRDGQTVLEYARFVPGNGTYMADKYKWKYTNNIDFNGESTWAGISPVYGWTTFFVGANMVWGDPAWDGSTPEGWTWVSPFNPNPGPATPPTPETDVINNSLKPFVLQVLIRFPYVGQWDVRIRRETPISNDTRLSNTAIWTQARSMVAGNILALDRPHTMIEVYARADERLSGVIQTLNAVGTSYIRSTRDGVNFVTTPCRNPAWIALDIMQGRGNPRPVPDNLIDWPSWVAFADYCDAPRTWNIEGEVFTQARHTFDAIIDYDTSIKELVDSILSNCRAMLVMNTAGKYGVQIDQARTTPRQLITPANSWNFKGERTFAEDVHALRVSYVSSAAAYQKQEVIVYRDGYDASNATLYEDLGTFGITDHYRAWAFGRYFLAQAIIRSESFSVDMALENLVVTRGDLVRVAHDVPKLGGMACRIIAIGGATIVTDQAVTSMPSAYTVRLQDGTIRTGSVLAVVDSNHFTLDTVAGLAFEDLIVLGTSERVTESYIVQSIEPQADLVATISLVPYNAAIYDADIGQMPVWEPHFSDDHFNGADLRIDPLTVSETIVYRDRLPYSRAFLQWHVTANLYDHCAIYVDIPGQSQTFLGYVRGYDYAYEFNTVNSPEIEAGTITFTLTPYTAAGTQGTTRTITYSGTRDTTAPAAVSTFSTNVQSEHISIFWVNQSDPDIDYHEIRYSPDPVNGSWFWGQLLAKVPYNVNQFAIGARTGMYFLRSYDTSGNASPVVYSRTSVADLPYVKLTETIDETPDWPGAKSDCEVYGDDLQMSGTWGALPASAFYFFHRTIDLGDIYQIRASTYLAGNGVMSDELLDSIFWMPVSAKRPLVNDDGRLYHACVDYRACSHLVVVADWQPVVAGSITEPVAGLSHAKWTDWRELQVGDITGRYFQFRVRMESSSPYIRVHVDEAVITLEMVNRPYVLTDVAISSAGQRVTFSPAFMAPPLVNVGIDGGTAYKYELSDHTNAGVTIKLFNGTTQVSGQVDIFALGYGIRRTETI